MLSLSLLKLSLSLTPLSGSYSWLSPFKDSSLSSKSFTDPISYSLSLLYHTQCYSYVTSNGTNVSRPLRPVNCYTELLSNIIKKKKKLFDWSVEITSQNLRHVSGRIHDVLWSSDRSDTPGDVLFTNTDNIATTWPQNNL